MQRKTLRFVLRLTAWTSGLLGIALFVLATFIDEKKNAIINFLWRGCAVIAVLEFAFDSVLGWLDEKDAEKLEAELNQVKEHAAATEAKAKQLKLELAAATEKANRVADVAADAAHRAKEIEFKQQIWHVTNEEAARIRSRLSQHAGQSFAFMVATGDRDGTHFRDDLSRVLLTCGWITETRPRPPLNLQHPLVDGTITVVTNPEDADNQKLKSVVLDLSSLGIGQAMCFHQEWTGVPKSSVLLVLHRKPEATISHLAKTVKQGLTKEQVDHLRLVLNRFPGQKIGLEVPFNDERSDTFVHEMLYIFIDIGWIYMNIPKTNYPLDFQNIKVCVGRGDFKGGTIPPAAHELKNALNHAGLACEDRIFMWNDLPGGRNDMPPGMIVLRFGNMPELRPVPPENEHQNLTSPVPLPILPQAPP